VTDKKTARTKNMAAVGTGVLAQLVSTTEIDEAMTGAASTITFFKAKSEPYGRFATDWQKLSFTKNSLGTDTTETSADVVRSGDMLAHMYLVIKAPPLFNVTVDACDISGNVTNAAYTTSGYSASVAALKKRAYVGSTRSDNYGPGRLLISGTTDTSTALKTWVVIDGDKSAKIYPGCRMQLLKYTPSAVPTTTDIEKVLKLNNLNNLSEFYNKANEVSSASFASGDLVLTKVKEVDEVGTASEYIELLVTVSAVAVAGGKTYVSWHEPLVTTTAVAYTYRVYAQDDLGTLRPDMNAAVVSINAPGVSATNALAAGPHKGGATTGIVSRDPLLDPMNFAAHYGTYAPVQLIKQISMVIGANVVSTLTALVIQAHLELFTASDRLMRRMVNASRDPEELCAWALQQNVWYVPIPFWFGSSPSYQSSLPLVALSFHTITINLTMQPYTQCIVNGCGGDMTDRAITMGASFGTGAATTLETHAGPRALDAVTGMGDGTAAPTFASTKIVESANFVMFLLAEYVYLDEAERALYTDMTDEVLITQWQYATNQILTNDDASEVSLRFNHPVQCLLFGGKLQSSVNDHRHGEYEGPSNPLTVSAKRPEGTRQYWLKEAQIKFNNSARTQAHGPEFFHQLMPSLAAERVPDSHIFYYPFAVAPPTGPQYAGSANFSRLDSVTLTLQPFSHLFKNQKLWGGLDGSVKAAGAGTMLQGQQVLVEIAAANANTFTFDNGMGGPGYV
jgi:hypothetical protein